MSIWHHLTSYKKITAPLIQEADPQGFWCSLDEGGLALHCWSLSLPVTGHKAPRCQQQGLPLVFRRSSAHSQGWQQRAVACLSWDRQQQPELASLLLLECLHLCLASGSCWRQPCVLRSRVCGDPLDSGGGVRVWACLPGLQLLSLNRVVQSGSAPLNGCQADLSRFHCTFAVREAGPQDCR